MELTKYGHACVRLSEHADSIVIDPGRLTPEPEAWENARAVLITHEHFDHFDEEALDAALADAPNLRIITCAGVAQKLESFPRIRDHVEVMKDGQTVSVGSFRIAAVGALHNYSHPDASPVNNIGFLINDTVLHPGDALTAVPAPVLLAPGQAPWLTVPDLVTYIRASQRDRIYAIHDGLLNHWGLQVLDSVLDLEAQRAGIEIRRLHVGETVHL
ncbi:MBL fold metallo-hydrolase [Arthrobacter sp. TMT4-20]